MPKFTEKRPVCVFDTECFVNYWAIAFKSVEDGRMRVFEHYDGNPLDRTGVAKILRQWRIIGFNSIAYDMPMVVYAMSGASPAELKRLNDEIILGGTPYWTVYDRIGVKVPDFVDHIDLMSVSPGAPQKPSLKLLGGRLHSKKMQEMPVEIDEWIGDIQRQVVQKYHVNDLDTTIDLYNDLRAQVDLRATMSDEYGVDLRSKSDAQIAEAVIRTEIEKATGTKLEAPLIKSGVIRYMPPSFVKFLTPYMQEVLATVREAKFAVDPAGVVHMPDSIKQLKITLGKGTYQMGIGGLHSTESQVSHYSDDEHVLIDRDVTSYYPNIIQRCELFPKHIGPRFLAIYRKIYERRIAAKRAGEKNTAETLKIVLNGSFGKFGSPYSVLYSPDLMLQTTITGQLCLLMFIEWLESRDIPVVSANTDGVVAKVPRAMLEHYEAVVKVWEQTTGFETEATEYRSLHSRDVNNYIAIKAEKGEIKAKLKGTYAESGPGLPGAAGQKKNPDCDIATEAVVEYLKHGTEIEKTIYAATDFRKFVTVRRVTGGAEQEGQYIGKTIRWFYAEGIRSGFVYKKSGNSVPRSIGAKPCMQLPDRFPWDEIDYDFYIREAYAILEDIGAEYVDPKLRGRTGTFLGRLPDTKNYHIVDARSGKAICGKKRDSIRDAWIEADDLPDGHRLCPKCKKADEL